MKQKTYYVEIEVSNCLLTPEVRATHFAAGDKTKKAANCIQILYIKEANETRVQESAIKFLENEPVLKSLITNTVENPTIFKVVKIEAGFDGIPATKKILAASYFFYLKGEQFDSFGDSLNNEELMPTVIKSDPENVYYSKISKEKLFKKGVPVWNPILANHIGSNTIQVNWNENDAQIIDVLPEVIKNLYYLWWFKCEAGGSGISGFILQNNSHHIKGSYLALKAIGEKSLAKLLGHAIAITIDDKEEQYGAEYCYSAPDLTWFKSFTNKSNFQEIGDLDDHEDKHKFLDLLDNYIVKYINNNIEEIAV